MKTLATASIEDTRDYLHLTQKANGIRAVLDVIINDTKTITSKNVIHKDFVVVSIDASNAYNRCSRQLFLKTLPQRAPILARFCNLIYANTSHPLIIPTYPPHIILSRDGAQNGDPPSMLLLSISVHELLRELVP